MHAYGVTARRLASRTMCRRNSTPPQAATARRWGSLHAEIRRIPVAGAACAKSTASPAHLAVKRVRPRSARQSARASPDKGNGDKERSDLGRADAMRRRLYRYAADGEVFSNAGPNSASRLSRGLLFLLHQGVRAIAALARMVSGTALDSNACSASVFGPCLSWSCGGVRIGWG